MLGLEDSKVFAPSRLVTVGLSRDLRDALSLREVEMLYCVIHVYCVSLSIFFLRYMYVYSMVDERGARGGGRRDRPARNIRPVARYTPDEPVRARGRGHPPRRAMRAVAAESVVEPD